MKLLRYTGKRLLILFPQLVAIVTLVFFLIRLLPADPVARIVGLTPTPSAIAQAKRSLGIDTSMASQFGTYVNELLHGGLGKSWVSGGAIRTEIWAHFPITIQLMVMGFLIALVIAIPLGMMTAVKPGGRIDRSLFVYGLFAGSQPDFWWGLTFVFLFVFKLHIFPIPQGLDPGTHLQNVTGFDMFDALITGNFTAFVNLFDQFLLPALTMAFVISGPIVKMVRQNMLRFRESNFLLYARANGLGRRKIATYTLRNALSPVVTLIGILFGFEIGGAVLIETVFSLNGLGQYAVQRTLQLDYPAIQGIVLTMTAFSLLVYLAMDLLYTVIDPRIKY
jgi:ABC-type dipeptide/oligopeptide/nickel transport system permease component